MEDQLVDVAIVGAGVSGVYCGWRLKQAQPDLNVIVYEGSGTIGGRLLSVRPPGIKDMVAELGGMRILPAVQPRITALIDELNAALPAEDQIELYDFPVDEPQNLAYLRGTHLRLSDFTTSPDQVPYQVSFLERGDSPGGIIVGAIEQVVPGITNPNLTDEQRRALVQTATFAGRPLYEQGFWNVLMRIISGEAFQLGVDAGGYSTTLSNWNAADAIPWFLSDFGVKPAYKGFKQGYQRVPLSLASLFQQAGGQIQLQSKLAGFSWHEGTFELQLTSGSVRARHLILAMPRRSLDLLAPTSSSLQQIQPLISSVTPRPLFKLFTTYTNPWWRNAGYTDAQGNYVPVEAGRSVTDLPVRQTYYWPTDDGKPATSGPAMLMASYDDGNNVGYWDGLRPQRRQAWQMGQQVAPPSTPFTGQNANPDSTEHPSSVETWNHYQASQGMVEEVARQLAIIHGLNHTPQVQQAAFRDWGDDPFGGGWNSWNIGVKSWEVKQQIIKPIEDQPLYICGEAYSDAQGWVEGALQTADYVLAKLQATAKPVDVLAESVKQS